jgi:RNA polymerase sigma-70 factor (ECF subfamily)
MKKADEKILVRKAASGDVSAFREITERHQRQIYCVAHDFTGNHHDAEDILQEVLIKAHRSMGAFQGKAKLSSWFHRITINSCIDRERRASLPTTAIEELSQNSGRLVEFNPRTNPEQQAESARIQKHIDQALRRLSPLERSVFILRQYQQLPIREVAQVLERSEGTVKNILWRALKKLQKELAFYKRDFGFEASQ